MSEAITSGTTQWLRKVSLVAADEGGNGLELSALRVTFTATSWLVAQPALLVARVYNLSDQTAQKLLSLKTVPVGGTLSNTPTGGSNSKVTLQAGYEGNFGIIFSGDLIQAKWGRETPTDTFVDLIAGDGFQGHVWGIINASLSSGWQGSDVNDKIKSTYSQYNVNLDDLPDDVQQQQAPRGKVMYGMVRDYRRDLARSYGLNGYVYQGNGKWLPWNKALSTTIIQVNSQTGMIGMPMQTQYGATVRMLLNPKVGPGSLLQLNNKDVQRLQFATGVGQTSPNAALQTNLGDGTYKVLAVTHTGDTRGQEWYSDCPLISTSSQSGAAYVPDEYLWALQLG